MASLIVALDTPDRAKALALAENLRGAVEWFKIGLELFTSAGPDIVRGIKDMGLKVFLDLKFYDIPNTVASAVKSAATLNIDMLTLHCQGGRRMCEAAREAADAAIYPPLLFGVTVLTSFAGGEMPGIEMEPAEYGIALARDAGCWGLDGVVCSGHEAASIRKISPKLLTLCPGIRPQGEAAGDQRRVVTPARAVAAGANYIVVGRPVTRAQDPVVAARRIIAEMAAA